MSLKILSATIVGLALTGCAAKATLHGNVTHERTLGLLPDARVVITGPGESSDAQTLETNYAGRFSTKLKPGKYRLNVEREGLLPCAGNPEDVELAEGEVRELRLCLSDG